MKKAISHVSASDARIGGLVERQGAIELKPHGRAFQWLVRSIIFQQLNGNAARVIHSRVTTLFSPGGINPEKLSRASTTGLRRAGVSPQKITYLKDLASRAIEGKLELRGLSRRSDEEIIQMLDEVRGVGRWTAQMVLIFSLGRADVLPVDDFGLRTAMKDVYGLRDLPRPERMEKIAAPWHPYSSVASLYLWGHKDST